MFEFIVGAIGFFLTLPLKALIAVLENKAIDLLSKDVTGKFAKNKFVQMAVNVGRPAAIAALRGLVALINVVISIIQVLGVVGTLIVLALIIIIYIAAVIAALTTMNMEGGATTVGGGGSLGTLGGSTSGQGSTSSTPIEWVECVDTLGDWYASNITTYMSSTDNTQIARKGYTCDILTDEDGNAVTVSDDCSSFVSNCLKLAGYHDIDGQEFVSGDFCGSGSATTILTEAGFVNIGSFDENADTLQMGDILAVNGHVEVFSNYAEDGSVMSWTWGAIYSSLPAVKSYKAYTDVWRLED